MAWKKTQTITFFSLKNMFFLSDKIDHCVKIPFSFRAQSIEGGPGPKPVRSRGLISLYKKGAQTEVPNSTTCRWSLGLLWFFAVERFFWGGQDKYTKSPSEKWVVPKKMDLFLMDLLTWVGFFHVIFDVLLDALRCLMMFDALLSMGGLRLACWREVHWRWLISVWDRPVHVWVYVDPLHLYVCSQNHWNRCQGSQCDVAKLLQGSFYQKKAFPGSWHMFPMNEPLKKQNACDSIWRLENRFAATFGVLVSENA